MLFWVLWACINKLKNYASIQNSPGGSSASKKERKKKKNKKIQETNPEKLQILILCTLHYALCPTYYVQQHQPKKTLSLCRGH